MSKAVLLSIRPQWCELIATGEKTIELRKNRPKLETPFKCYIYQTKLKWIYKIFKKLGLWQGKVIGEFECDRIEEIYEPYLTWLEEKSCVDMNDIAEYKGKKDLIYGWCISNLKIYDKPKELSEFKNSKNKFIERAFQSWGYVEEREEEQ